MLTLPTMSASDLHCGLKSNSAPSPKSANIGCASHQFIAFATRFFRTNEGSGRHESARRDIDSLRRHVRLVPTSEVQHPYTSHNLPFLHSRRQAYSLLAC